MRGCLIPGAASFVRKPLQVLAFAIKMVVGASMKGGEKNVYKIGGRVSCPGNMCDGHGPEGLRRNGILGNPHLSPGRQGY